jgi:ABC-type cobalamin/Fe3+-siderophores transport system ATPase subunit
MSTHCGPHKIVALHCGKFDFAELEIDVPVHLIGPNNVGKTSLISLLQFLYLDDQRVMQFCRDMADTRRYYFPEKYSYALFECLTPTGFQVVGVHGLGPVRQHEYERFVYTGRIELSDYLDNEKRMREPEDTLTLLANKGFKRMEPRHLKAALTGVGDARDVFLGLVPAKHSTTYERFRKVFGNILRLSTSVRMN